MIWKRSCCSQKTAGSGEVARSEDEAEGEEGGEKGGEADEGEGVGGKKEDDDDHRREIDWSEFEDLWPLLPQDGRYPHVTRF